MVWRKRFKTQNPSHLSFDELAYACFPPGVLTFSLVYCLLRVLTSSGADRLVLVGTSFQEVPYSCFCLRSVRGKAPSHFYRPVSLGKVFGHVGTPSKPTDKGDVIQADFQDQHLLMVLMSVCVFLRCSAGQVTVPFFLIFTGLLALKFFLHLIIFVCLGFSLVAASGSYSLVAVHGMLIAVASLAAEQGL